VGRHRNSERVALLRLARLGCLSLDRQRLSVTQRRRLSLLGLLRLRLSSLTLSSGLLQMLVLKDRRLLLLLLPLPELLLMLLSLLPDRRDLVVRQTKRLQLLIRHVRQAVRRLSQCLRSLGGGLLMLWLR
jgi:hypothetical protein